MAPARVDSRFSGKSARFYQDLLSSPRPCLPKQFASAYSPNRRAAEHHRRLPRKPRIAHHHSQREPLLAEDLIKRAPRSGGTVCGWRRNGDRRVWAKQPAARSQPGAAGRAQGTVRGSSASGTRRIGRAIQLIRIAQTHAWCWQRGGAGAPGFSPDHTNPAAPRVRHALAVDGRSFWQYLQPGPRQSAAR
jgi:hypothetical protein